MPTSQGRGVGHPHPASGVQRRGVTLSGPGLLQLVRLESVDLGGERSGDGPVAPQSGSRDGEERLALGGGELACGAGMFDDRRGGFHVGEVVEEYRAECVGGLVEIAGVCDFTGRDEGERAVDLRGVQTL